MELILTAVEQKAINTIKNIIADNSDYQFENSFDSAEKLLQYLKENNGEANLIFLDLDLDGFYAFETAEKILALNSEINIVFISSDNQKFFKLLQKKSLAYLVKPISKESFKQLISKIKAEKSSIEADSIIEIYVEILGELELYDLDRNHIDLQWSDEKVKELFAFLLHHKGEFVSQEEIIEELWGDKEDKINQALFCTTIFKLRKVFADLSFKNIIEREADSYRLSLKNIAADFLKIEKILEKDLKNKYNLYQLLNLYSDSYLTAEDYDWCKEYRKEFEKRVKKELNHAAKYFKAVGQNTITKNILAALIVIDPEAENPYNQLLNIYRKEGNRKKAKEIEENLNHKLEIVI